MSHQQPPIHASSWRLRFARALLLVAWFTGASPAIADELAAPWQWYLSSGSTSGQLVRPNRESSLGDRVFDYSGMNIGGGYQGFYRNDFLLDAAAGVLVAYASKKVISQSVQIGGAYALLGGANQRRTPRGQISVTSRYPYGLFVGAKVVHSGYTFASSRNTFDDTTGSVIHFVASGEWYLYLGDALGMGVSYQKSLNSFANSTDSLSSQENRILFMLLMTH